MNLVAKTFLLVKLLIARTYRYSLLPTAAFASHKLFNKGRDLKYLLLMSDFLTYVGDSHLDQFGWDSRALLDELNLYSKRISISCGILLIKLGFRFDVIGLKIAWDADQNELIDTIDQITQLSPNSKIVFFDGDDDLAISKPQVLEKVDLYIKKQGFKDRSDYRKSWIGKSNLTDYVSKKYGISFANNELPHTEPIPEHLIKKLHFAHNLAASAKIHRLYEKHKFIENSSRPIDLSYRASIPDDWTKILRSCMLDQLNQLALKYNVVLPTTIVSREKYYEEMLASKICLAPFGYGEQCFREFEGIVCRCLILKPDLSHSSTYPDLFVEYETYVPLKWDYSDLIEKAEEYINNEKERNRIAQNAYQALRDYYENKEFIQDTKQWLDRLDVY